jgi:hypothetical protein
MEKRGVNFGSSPPSQIVRGRLAADFSDVERHFGAVVTAT